MRLGIKRNIDPALKIYQWHTIEKDNDFGQYEILNFYWNPAVAIYVQNLWSYIFNSVAIT